MKKKTNITYDLDLNVNQTRILLSTVIVLLAILLFKKHLNNIVEKYIVFTILFLLILIISKNLVVTFIATCIIFLLFNLLMKYKNTVENFKDLEKDTDTLNEETLLKSKEGISELLKKLNGGIKLTEDDTKETSPLNINLEKYSDDKTPNALKIAQKETYELINTVNALKDTITTLAPVLQEGKKLMSMFENMKI